MQSGIVTRGFAANTIVTRGYGKGEPVQRRPVIIEALAGVARRGRSAYKKQVETVLVAAKLMRVNSIRPDPQIVGTDSTTFTKDDPRVRARSVAKLIGTEVKKTSERIVIRVARILDPKEESDGDS